ncbi:MAG: MATE family efflux transporter [Eubacteriales bacterium]|nr:MATE family efflux transporter [Eubacteriales bacterium]
MKGITEKAVNNKEESIFGNICSQLLTTGIIMKISQVGSGFLDSLMVSVMLGSAAMAAQGLSLPIFSMAGMLSALLAGGMQVLCAERLGDCDKDGFSRIFSCAVMIGGALSLVFSVLLFIFPLPMAHLLGANESDPVLLHGTIAYIHGLAPMFFIGNITSLLIPAVQMDGGNKIVRAGAIAQAISDIILNFLTIKLGMGLFGVGLSTTAAYAVNNAFMLTHFLKKDRMLKLVMPKTSPGELFNMVMLGSTKLVKRFGEILKMLIVNRVILALGGSLAMTALATRNSLGELVFIVADGLMIAVGITTGICFGEQNEEGLHEVGHYAHKITFLSFATISALLILLAWPISIVYGHGDPGLRKMIIFSCFALAADVPLYTLVTSRISYLQGLHKVKAMQLTAFAQAFLCVLISVAAFGVLFGTYGVIASFTFSNLLLLIATYVSLQIKNKKLILTASDMMNLPSDFLLDKSDVLSKRVHTKAEAADASESIRRFCLQHGFDKKHAYFASLAVEELTINTVEYGFPANQSKQPYVALRACFKDGKLVIRLQDNCPQFDPVERIKENIMSDDPTCNIGLRMLRPAARMLTYIRTFETNMLMIEM